MKKLLTVIFILAAFVSNAQDDKNVEENNEKIGELNDRLDRLINGSKQISGDSINIKIDQLISDIKEIKTEIKELKETVNKITEEGVPMKSKGISSMDEIAVLNEKLTDLDEGSYYIVVASAREERYANNKLRRIQESGNEVVLVKNSIGTWYHVILKQEYNLVGAIKKVNAIRSGKYDDAWFSTSKKLKL